MSTIGDHTTPPSPFGPAHAPALRRFVGALVDAAAAAVPATAISVVLQAWVFVEPEVVDRLNTEQRTAAVPLSWWLSAFGCFLGYRVLCWQFWERTLGQAWMGLRLVAPHPARLPVLFLRALLEALLGALCGLGYWWIVLNPHSAHLADEVLGTRVEMTAPPPDPNRAGVKG